MRVKHCSKEEVWLVVPEDWEDLGVAPAPSTVKKLAGVVSYRAVSDKAR